MTGGRGVDHIIEVGGPGTMAQSIHASRMGGHIALIGVPTGVSGEIPTAALIGNQVTVSGIAVGSRADQEDMIRALSASERSSYAALVWPKHKISGAEEVGNILPLPHLYFAGRQASLTCFNMRTTAPLSSKIRAALLSWAATNV